MYLLRASKEIKTLSVLIRNWPFHVTFKSRYNLCLDTQSSRALRALVVRSLKISLELNQGLPRNCDPDQVSLRVNIMPAGGFYNFEESSSLRRFGHSPP